MSSIVELNEQSFDDVIASSSTPVVVDFWAEWCGPCKMIAPVLEELSRETDSIQIAKLNVDESPDLARRYSVLSIPTLLVFDQGVEKKRLVVHQGLGTPLHPT